MQRFKFPTAWYNFVTGRYDYLSDTLWPHQGMDYVPQTLPAMREYVRLLLQAVPPEDAVLMVSIHESAMSESQAVDEKSSIAVL